MQKHCAGFVLMPARPVLQNVAATSMNTASVVPKHAAAVPRSAGVWLPDGMRLSPLTLQYSSKVALLSTNFLNSEWA